jgi:hypothetical protein
MSFASERAICVKINFLFQNCATENLVAYLLDVRFGQRICWKSTFPLWNDIL